MGRFAGSRLLLSLVLLRPVAPLVAMLLGDRAIWANLPIGKQAIEVPALASNCKITDLATTLQEEGNKNAQNSDLRRSMEAQMRAAQQGKAMINPVQAISVQR